jgi:hypothetical protein
MEEGGGQDYYPCNPVRTAIDFENTMRALDVVDQGA